MSTKIWVYSEINSGEITKVVYEIVSKANQLALSFDGDVSVEAVLLGENLDKHIEKLAFSGVDKIYAVDDPRLSSFSPLTYIPVFTDLVTQNMPDILLFGATAFGNVLGASIAALLKTGMAAHCVDLRINDEKLLVANVPAFCGKVIGEILCPEHRPQIASVKQGVFIENGQSPKPVNCVKCSASILDTIDLSRLVLLKSFDSQPKGIPLNNAELVISGGFGVGSKENWQILESIAKKIGAAVACTRPVVDATWADESHMVGTSGLNIKPKIYLGFGISGATHHICGMSSSDYVINVNKDINAPFFHFSDVNAVANVEEVLPILDAMLK